MAQSLAVKAPTAKSASNDNRITVRNPNVPDSSSTVDAVKYHAMKQALLKALPQQSPGLTQAEMFDAVLPHLPEEIFPGGAKAGWWVKCVQLDLEAQGVIVREASKPLRWHQM
jgi:hypothetical protein